MLFRPLFFFLFLSLYQAFAYEDPLHHICNTSTTAYLANSTFSGNLDLALGMIRSSTAATGFYATTVGNSITAVSALGLCRASLSPSDCQSCIDAATLGVLRVCSYEAEAQVWYSLCMVRYSESNFIHKPDNSIAFTTFDTRDVPNQVQYDQTVRILMQKLSYTAGFSMIKSAVGSTSTVGNRSIYGDVECTRDLNGNDCTTCLSHAIEAIPSCCSGKWGGWIVTPSCNIQFNMDPVHADWVTAPVIDTSTPVPGSGGGGGGRGTDLMMRISIAVFVIAMLAW